MSEFSSLTEFAPTLMKSVATLRGGREIALMSGLSACLELLSEVRTQRRKVILIGNGGSAAISSHQAVDLWRNAGIRAMTFNDAALLTCTANDFGYANVFKRPLEVFGDCGDLLIAISSSGESANILRGCQQGLHQGLKVITLTGFEAENAIRPIGDVNFYVPSRSYGIVEVAHLLLIHTLIDECTKGEAVFEYLERSQRQESSLFDVTNPTN